MNDLLRFALKLRSGLAEMITKGDDAEIASAVREVYGLVERIQEAGFNEHGVKPACPKGGGCSACCCELVEAGMVEAMVSARYIRDAGNVALKLRARLALWLVTHEDLHRRGVAMKPTEYIMERLVCPFLDPTSKTCCIYEVRPVGCRTYVSEQPPERCHQALADGAMRTLMLPVVQEAAFLGCTVLVHGPTCTFQEGVAWFLGMTEAPRPMHDMRAMIAKAEMMDHATP